MKTIQLNHTTIRFYKKLIDYNGTDNYEAHWSRVEETLARFTQKEGESVEQFESRVHTYEPSLFELIEMNRHDHRTS